MGKSNAYAWLGFLLLVSCVLVGGAASNHSDATLPPCCDGRQRHLASLAVEVLG